MRPVRWLVCLVVLSASFHAAGAAESLPPLPDSQRAFCAILQAGMVAYNPLLKAWGDASDPVIKNDTRAKMATLRIERDKAIFDLLSRNHLRVTEWHLHTDLKSIANVTQGENGVQDMTVRADALCPIPVTIETTLSVNPPLLRSLREGSTVKNWTVSGVLVGRDTVGGFAPVNLVWTESEANAMRAPSYHLDILEFRIATEH